MNGKTPNTPNDFSNYNLWDSLKHRRPEAFISIFAIIAVILYEYLVKRSHSEYWLLELIVTVVVVPALVLIAGSIDRLLTGLTYYRNELDQVSTGFGGKADDLTKRLGEVESKLQSHAQELVGQGTILYEIYGNSLLGKQFQEDSESRKQLVSFLNKITTAWGEVLDQSSRGTESSAPLKSLARNVWSHKILPIYAQEECQGLTSGCIATNSRSYFAILEGVIDAARDLAAMQEGSGLQVHLQAVTNLLPEEWYNWKEFSPGAHEEPVNYGRALPMLDGYREKISEMICDKNQYAPLTMERIILTYADTLEDDDPFTNQLNLLGIQRLGRLRRQLQQNSILCDENIKPCKAMNNIALTYLAGCHSMREKLSNQGHITGLHEVYCIANDNIPVPRSIPKYNWKRLSEIYINSLHSADAKDHARYFEFDDSSSNLLALLPKIPKELLLQTDDFPCTDYLSVRATNETYDKICLVIASRFSPNRETMLLRFITNEDQCSHVKEFWDKAISKNLKLVDLT